MYSESSHHTTADGLKSEERQRQATAEQCLNKEDTGSRLPIETVSSQKVDISPIVPSNTQPDEDDTSYSHQMLTVGYNKRQPVTPVERWRLQQDRVQQNYEEVLTSTPRTPLPSHSDTHQGDRATLGPQRRDSPVYGSNRPQSEHYRKKHDYHREVKEADSPCPEAFAEIPNPAHHESQAETHGDSVDEPRYHWDPDKPARREMEASRVAIQKWQDATQHVN